MQDHHEYKQLFVIPLDILDQIGKWDTVHFSTLMSPNRVMGDNKVLSCHLAAHETSQINKGARTKI